MFKKHGHMMSQEKTEGMWVGLDIRDRSKISGRGGRRSSKWVDLCTLLERLQKMGVRR